MREADRQVDIFGGECELEPEREARQDASEQLALTFGDTPNRGQTSMEEVE